VVLIDVRFSLLGASGHHAVPLGELLTLYPIIGIQFVACDQGAVGQAGIVGSCVYASVLFAGNVGILILVVGIVDLADVDALVDASVGVGSNIVASAAVGLNITRVDAAVDGAVVVTDNTCDIVRALLNVDDGSIVDSAHDVAVIMAAAGCSAKNTACSGAVITVDGPVVIAVEYVCGS
jgi:hypothetical protein